MIPDDSRKLLLVQRCGPVAARVLQASATATVAAVFERSFYIEADGQFACIGSNCIGDGPLNAIVSETSLSSTLATIVPSQKIALSSHERSAVIQLDALRAVIWRPSI